MRTVFIIAKREFRLFFVSPAAYSVSLMIFLILGGIFFINIYFGLRDGQIAPDGRMVISPLVTILLFATPAITMRLLADEQRMGTIELLLTSPVRIWELVVGKWLGATGFMMLILGVTWIYPIIIHRMTNPGIDQGVLIAAYLGLVFMISAMLAIGTFISSLFNNPIPAFFITLTLMLFLWIIGGLGSGSGTASEIASNLSFVAHYYDNLYRGVIDLGDLVYYMSLTIISLFLGTQVLESRRWR